MASLADDLQKRLIGVIIICLKFDCSKNLLNTILLLLDTVRTIIFFLVNCSNPVNLWESTGFEQFHFQSKKYQLFENKMVDKGGEKCQLLDTIYSKENGVHVRQLGQVRCACMAVRLGVSVDQVSLGYVRLGQVRCTCMNRNRNCLNFPRLTLKISNYVEQKSVEQFQVDQCIS